jgi:hypothetical protein
LPLWRLTWTVMWQWPTCQTVYTFLPHFLPLYDSWDSRHIFLPPLPPLNRHHTLQSSAGRTTFLLHMSPLRQWSPSYQSMCTHYRAQLGEDHAPHAATEALRKRSAPGEGGRCAEVGSLALSLPGKEKVAPLVPVAGVVRHHHHPGERREGRRVEAGRCRGGSRNRRQEEDMAQPSGRNSDCRHEGVTPLGHRGG